MDSEQHDQRNTIQVQRDASLVSKYSYKKGDGHQEVFGAEVNIVQSAIRKSGKSHHRIVRENGEIVTHLVGWNTRSGGTIPASD